MLGDPAGTPEAVGREGRTYVYGEMMSTVILVNIYHLVLIRPPKEK